MNPYLSLAISILIGVCGQISLKAGAIQSFGNKMLFLQPYVVIGLLSYFLAALFYIYSLKYIPISVAFPSVSISYVAVVFLGHLLWGEAFGVNQIFALLLIGLGIYILNYS
ncbi:MAG: EamA family transporter [Nostoc sp.]|uniref:EamA family transporter n=1 Tax=Nostoc sp. TaxID=1180 RepID=UPI002FF64312